MIQQLPTAAIDMHRSVVTSANALAPVPVPPLGQLVSGWLLGYRSENTRRAYWADFAAWDNWLQVRDLEPLTARRAHVDAWARHAESVERLRPSTVARRVATLASFYRYCVDEAVLEASPVANVRRPRTGEGHVELTPGVEPDEIRLLVAAATAPKDRAALLLLLILGLRVSEAIAMDFEDVRTVRGHQTVIVRGKGGREDRVPLPPVLLDAIDHLATSEGRRQGPVLLGRDGQRISPQAVSRLLSRLSRSAGLHRTVRPHMLRVSAITTALDAGASLRRVQDFARHADPRTTRRYDRGRGALDDHASYVVAGWLSEGMSRS